LLGKFREHDWWVHSSDVQIGIFAELASPEAGQMLDAMSGKLSEYSDGQDTTAQSVPEPKQRE
jgi:hypothetical protein